MQSPALAELLLLLLPLQLLQLPSPYCSAPQRQLRPSSSFPKHLDAFSSSLSYEEWFMSALDIAACGSPFVWSKIWTTSDCCRQNLCLKQRKRMDVVWLQWLLTKSFMTITLPHAFLLLYYSSYWFDIDSADTIKTYQVIPFRNIWLCHYCQMIFIAINKTNIIVIPKSFPSKLTHGRIPRWEWSEWERGVWGGPNIPQFVRIAQ